MSDERQSAPVSCFAHRLSDCIPAVGSLKRKFDQTIPISRSVSGAYPSPPMSNPPSPIRQPPQLPTSTVPQHQVWTTGSCLPTVSSEQPASLFPPSAQEPLSSPFIERGGDVLAPTAPSSQGTQASGAPIATFSGGQNVFSITSTATADIGGAATSTTTTPKAGRKAKAHVASACMNCKRAHLSCDTQRPCTRCVTSGKQDTCFDVPHKKRGRPRLRDENEFKVEQMLPEQTGQSAAAMASAAAGPSSARPIARTRHQRTESLRSLRSQTSEGSSGSSMPTPGFPPMLQPGWIYQPPRPPSSGMSATFIPTAFLDLDFHFIRANQPFQQILCGSQEVRGRQLHDLVVPADGTSFVPLRGSLKGEREAREPAHMPPILQPGEDPIQGVMEDDVDRLARGFSDTTYTWARAGSGSQSRETFPARVRLAKATAYFVVVTLPSFRPVEMLPPRQPTSLPSQGYMIPPPPAPILPSQQPDPRIESHSAPPSAFLTQPSMAPQRPFPSPSQTVQSRAYPSIQPYQPHSQPYAAPPRTGPPTTPRLPTTEPPMQLTPITPLATAQRQQQHAASMQLPPLTGTPLTQAALPTAETASAAESGQQQSGSDDDEESPKKRRRMDISDVLQR